MSEPHTYEAIAEDQEMAADGDYDDGDDLFDDEDAEEAAEAVAKQLGDALWADISKAYAQQGTVQPVEAPGSLTNRPISPSLSEDGDDEETLANAIQIVLDLSTSQPSLLQALTNTVIPKTPGDTLLDVLTRLAEKTRVTPELAESLSCLVQSVADSEFCKVSNKTIVLSGHEQPTVAPGQGRLPSFEVEEE